MNQNCAHCRSLVLLSSENLFYRMCFALFFGLGVLCAYIRVSIDQFNLLSLVRVDWVYRVWLWLLWSTARLYYARPLCFGN